MNCSQIPAMLSKRFLLAIALCAHLSMCFCQSLTNPHAIILDHKEGNGPFSGGMLFTSTVNDKRIFNYDSSKYVNYLIKYISFEDDQNMYDKFANNEISKAQFDDYIVKRKLGNKKFVEKSYKHRLHFLVGQLRDNSVELIADVNYNNDFTDDKMLVYKNIHRRLNADEKRDTLLLPILRVTYEYYDGRKLRIGRTAIQPNLYKTSARYTDSLANSLPLMVSTYEHRTARIAVDTNTYDIFLSNFFLSAEYKKQSTELLIHNVNDTTRSRSYVTHLIGDSVKIDDKVFTLKDLSYGGDTLLIETRLSGKSIRGFDVGYKSYDFTRNDINDNKVSLSALKGNYIMLDFWGTWCVPCVEGIPLLKTLNDRYSKSKLKIISLAVESKKSDVVNYVKKYNMDWINIDDVYENEKNLASMFRVTSFPTFIVISPDGEIILREGSLHKVEEKLKNDIFLGK